MTWESPQTPFPFSPSSGGLALAFGSSYFFFREQITCCPSLPPKKQAIRNSTYQPLRGGIPYPRGVLIYFKNELLFLVLIIFRIQLSQSFFSAPSILDVTLGIFDFIEYGIRGGGFFFFRDR